MENHELTSDKIEYSDNSSNSSNDEPENEKTKIKKIKSSFIKKKEYSYLKSIMNKSKIKSELHKKTFVYFNTINNACSAIIIIINAITSILNIQYTAVEKEKDNETINYISALILILNSVFTGLINLSKFDEKIEYHKIKSSIYTNLTNEIEMFIIIGKKEDVTMNFYKRFNKYISNNTFIIPDWINTKYLKSIEESLDEEKIIRKHTVNIVNND